MNEFTKEELIDLNVLLAVWACKYPEDNITGKLLSKVEIMIDNYPDKDCQTIVNNPDCYCGQLDRYGVPITDCGYPPHECQHESDGEAYIINTPKVKCERIRCKKCGVFYR